MLPFAGRMARLVCCVSIAVLLLLVGCISTAGSTPALQQQPLRGALRHSYVASPNSDRPYKLGAAAEQAQATLAQAAGTGKIGRKANPAGGFPTYPKGDCATQCSRDLATRMAHCQADPSVGIPATQCPAAAAPGSGDDTCPTVRFPDAV